MEEREKYRIRYHYIIILYEYCSFCMVRFKSKVKRFELVLKQFCKTVSTFVWLVLKVVDNLEGNVEKKLSSAIATCVLIIAREK